MSKRNQHRVVSALSWLCAGGLVAGAFGGTHHYADNEFGNFSVNWSGATGTWWDDCADFTNGLGVPDESDHVIICASSNVKVDQNAAADTLEMVQPGAQGTTLLTIESGNTLTIDDDSIQTQSPSDTCIGLETKIVIEENAVLEFVETSQDIQLQGTIEVHGTLAFRDASHTISGAGGQIEIKGNGSILFEDADHTVTVDIVADYNPAIGGGTKPLISIDAGTVLTLDSCVLEGEVEIKGLAASGVANGAFHNCGKVRALAGDPLTIAAGTIVTDTADFGGLTARWQMLRSAKMDWRAEATGLKASFYVHLFEGRLRVYADVTTEGELNSSADVWVAEGNCFTWNAGGEDEDSIPEGCR